MTTMYTKIDAERTAEGTPLNSWTLLDLFGNDWSLLGGVQDLALAEDTVPSATTPTWVDMQTIWFEMPTWAVDALFDDMEFVVSLRVEAKVSAFPDCNLRLANAAESILGTSIVVTSATYVSARIELVFPAASIPTGRTEIKIQGQWASDPGTETLFTRKSAHTDVMLGDSEIYVRLVV